jgi:3',5'-cyclic AMP phosphodiesterase CpdA
MLIAQISDLHLRLPGEKAYGVVDTASMLPPAVAALNRFKPQPTLTVISGDLTDSCQPQEYAHLQSMLAPLQMPYFLVPGNHDSREEIVAAFPQHAYLRQMSGFVQYVIEDYPLRILALDTLVPMHTHGALCPERLDWLERKLAEQPRRPTVIVMHHPPFATGIGHMDAVGLLQGGPELEELVSRYPNVERILCGHVHRSIFRRFGGTVASICPSPAHQLALNLHPGARSGFVMEPPGFHLHMWQDGALITHHAVIGDYPGPYSFH